MERKNKVSKGIIDLIESFVAILFLAMILLVFVNVIGRFFFHAGITESEELAKIFFVWISLIGSVLCFSTDTHLCVDILVNILPGVPKKIVNIIANLLVTVILAIFIYYCTGFVMVNKGAAMPLTKLPIVLVQGILPVSLFIMLVMNQVKLVNLIRKPVKEFEKNDKGGDEK